jgi:hypothetical protein
MGGVIESEVNKEHHVSLSAVVGYSKRVSCNTLEARVVEILCLFRILEVLGLSLASESDCLHWT